MKNNLIIPLLLFVILMLSGALIYLHVPGFKHDTIQNDATVIKKQMYHCPMHPQIIADSPKDCSICGMKLVPIEDEHAGQDSSSEPQNIMAIRIDPTVVQNMGVTTAIVEKRSLNKAIRTSATLENNEKSITYVTSKVMGYTEKLYADFTGQSISKGDPLLTIYSPDLVTTQEEYLQAMRYSQSLRGASDLARKGALDLLESARLRLKNWDMTDAQIDTLTNRGTPERSVTIYAPASGIVLEKMVFSGQKIEPGMQLYKLVDISKIWAMANIYQEDLSFVKTGMTAEISVAAIPATIFTGKVTFISPVLDDISRTAKVRIEIPNTRNFILKPQMFATVAIKSNITNTVLSIPEQAVIRSGTRSIVIIALGNGYFKPQEIKTGTAADGYIEVIDGLENGTEIVTSSQFLIDSESNLRAAVRNLTSNQPSHETEQVNDSTVNETHSDSFDHSITPYHTDSVPKPQSGNSNSEYFCQMHPQIQSPVPGKCPICGMNLTKREN